MAKYIVDPKDVDERGIVRDGGKVRVPAYLRDGATVADAAAALQNLSVKDRAVALADIGRKYGRQSGYSFVTDSDAAVLKAAA